MGGPTGETKDAIIRMMYTAELQGRRARVKDMAGHLRLRDQTISGHLANLASGGYVVDPRQRGEWVLTPKGRDWARGLQVRRQGVAYRGRIAAGPAIPLFAEYVDEYLPIYDLDPDRHFALRVTGTSMVGFGILDGDIVILRTVTNWLEVPDGAIIAARVPEGTDVDDEHWLERLEQTATITEGAHAPPLDHVTLKKFDVRLRSYLSQGVEQQRIGVKLKGSQGNLRPLAVAVAGVLVRLQRDIPYRGVT